MTEDKKGFKQSIVNGSKSDIDISALISGLKEADATLAGDGYNSWCYTRLAISKAISELGKIEVPFEKIPICANVLVTKEQLEFIRNSFFHVLIEYDPDGKERESYIINGNRFIVTIKD